MNSIDLYAVLFCDGLTLLLIICTGLGSFMKLRGKTEENKLILTMLVGTFVSAIIDALCYTFDKTVGVVKPSGFTNYFIYLGYAAMTLANIGLLTNWNLLLTLRTKGKIDKKRYYIQGAIVVLGAILVIVNAFVPDFMYTVIDSEYKRGLMGYYIILGIYGIIALDGLVTYIISKIQGGLLSFLPMWLFMLPVVLGFGIDLAFTSISSRWVGFALGVTSVVMAMQNETIYKDKVTGAFNKDYVDLLKSIMIKLNMKKKYTLMILSLKGYNQINNCYGNLEGDHALLQASKLLKEAVGSHGAVIRYSKDEFVIILNTDLEALAKDAVLNINNVFKSFNSRSVLPYELSLSIAYKEANLRVHTIDEIVYDIRNESIKD